MELKNVFFAYNEEEGPMILNDVSCKIFLSSRVGIVGANGAGKSTLLNLLCGELVPSPGPGGKSPGEVAKHRNLRLAYIAQQHMFHLAEFLNCSPYVYIQQRYKHGWDEALQRRLLEPANEEEAKMRKDLAHRYGKYGNQVGDIVGRVVRGNEVLYEVQWANLPDQKQNTFEPVSKLKMMGVASFAKAFDERQATQAVGVDQRPLSQKEILATACGGPELQLRRVFPAKELEERGWGSERRSRCRKVGPSQNPGPGLEELDLRRSSALFDAAEHRSVCVIPGGSGSRFSSNAELCEAGDLAPGMRGPWTSGASLHEPPPCPHEDPLWRPPSTCAPEGDRQAPRAVRPRRGHGLEPRDRRLLRRAEVQAHLGRGLLDEAAHRRPRRAHELHRHGDVGRVGQGPRQVQGRHHRDLAREGVRPAG